MRVLAATLLGRAASPTQAFDAADAEAFLSALAGWSCGCGAQEVRQAEAGPDEYGAGSFGFYVHGLRLVGFGTLDEALGWLDRTPCLRCLAGTRGDRP